MFGFCDQDGGCVRRLDLVVDQEQQQVLGEEKWEQQQLRAIQLGGQQLVQLEHLQALRYQFVEWSLLFLT